MPFGVVRGSEGKDRGGQRGDKGDDDGSAADLAGDPVQSPADDGADRGEEGADAEGPQESNGSRGARVASPLGRLVGGFGDVDGVLVHTRTRDPSCKDRSMSLDPSGLL